MMMSPLVTPRTGREALCQQVANPNNPWKGTLDSLTKANEIATKNFQFILGNGLYQYNFKRQDWVHTPDVQSEDVNVESVIAEQPRVCDDFRNYKLERYCIIVI